MAWFDSNLSFLAPGWVGSLIGLLGLIGCIATYFLTRQRTCLVFAHTGERLLGLSSGGLPAGISVQYLEEDIPRLTRSVLIFWNSGEKTISREDIAEADPLRFSIGNDGEVLSTTILKSTRDVSNINIKPDPAIPNHVQLDFSFLDPGDGAVVEILHTSKESEPNFLGTVRGLPKGIKNVGKTTTATYRNQKNRKILPLIFSTWIIFLMGIASITIGIFGSSEAIDVFLYLGLKGNNMAIFMGVVYAFSGGFLIYISRRKYPKSLQLDYKE